MQALDPAAGVEEVLGRGQVPSLGRDPAEFQLHLEVERTQVGVGELAPWPQGEREAVTGAAKEVVVG
jgi:hypothetical protein